ncbi:MarR family winged helix-turn-helix transcriptional regulator [Anaerobacillus sp. MEB173]|uniref:MarR family winged helix-turn-helix transcriptional regulator n=1 Tax=Anaerobacillus sp. MEB173 TaxID=3383345 RepID=UPI003F923238
MNDDQINSKQVAEIEKTLRLIADLIKQRGREILTQFPITPPQFIALTWLYDHGDMTIGELSAKMYLAYSTTTDLIDRMETGELVERVRDKSDRRVVRIHLLDKGNVIIQEVIKQRQNYLKGILQNLPDDIVDRLEHDLDLLYLEMKKET